MLILIGAVTIQAELTYMQSKLLRSSVLVITQTSLHYSAN